MAPGGGLQALVAALALAATGPVVVEAYDEVAPTFVTGSGTTDLLHLLYDRADLTYRHVCCSFIVARTALEILEAAAPGLLPDVGP